MSEHGYSNRPDHFIEVCVSYTHLKAPKLFFRLPQGIFLSNTQHSAAKSQCVHFQNGCWIVFLLLKNTHINKTSNKSKFSVVFLPLPPQFHKGELKICLSLLLIVMLVANSLSNRSSWHTCCLERTVTTEIPLEFTELCVWRSLLMSEKQTLDFPNRKKNLLF